MKPPTAKQAALARYRAKHAPLISRVQIDVYGTPWPEEVEHFACGCSGDSPSLRKCDGLWIVCEARRDALKRWQERQRSAR